MKIIVSILLIALLSFAACLYLPWWVISITAFVVAAVIPQRPLLSFFSGFIALLLLWSLLAWYTSHNNEHILAHKISLLILKIDSPALLIVATSFIGALVAGFGALAGSFTRKEKMVVT